MTDQFSPTDRTRVRRIPKRGHYDKATIYPILDAALIGHVGIADGDQPIVIPTLIARDGDTLLLHGAATSRLLKHAEQGRAICVTVTHIDGLVLARSAFHHSVNYRSAVIFGTGRAVTDDSEKMHALAIFTDKLIPGRWADTRQPNPIEMKATAVIAIEMEEASAKIRAAGVIDDEEDYSLDYWAGIVPITPHFGQPLADERLPDTIPVPDYVTALVMKR
jgi:nitroimidazol reductase NimA-like FMN-containing flavoprotein (pyridoxamine 5'-phosphate oxidase superfamily)